MYSVVLNPDMVEDGGLGGSGFCLVPSLIWRAGIGQRWGGEDGCRFAKQKDGTYPPAYLVEGYFDVISWQEREIYNTVSSSGTAITEEHVKIIKRYTNHVVLVGDGDNAGFRSMLKSIDLFLQYDFKVEAIELPAGEDPHDYAKGWAPPLPGDENQSWQVLRNVNVENFAEEIA